MKHIAGAVFQNNQKISEVNFSDQITDIGAYAFDGCTNLTSVTIPKTVTRIDKMAIPDSCTISVYRPSAGYDYRDTNRIVLNSSYTTGNDTYYYVVHEDNTVEIIGCTTTSTELTVPEAIEELPVTTIGDYGFSGCSTLNSITIPANIKIIGKYAFQQCTGLVNATIPTTVNSVDDYAFYNCTGLMYVTISEGVKRLGNGVFYNCTSLTEAVVPDSAETLGAYAFYNCKSMTTATIGISADSVKEYTFFGCEKLENVVIGISVESIGDYAFYNCNLTRISIPSSTTSIGNYAFTNNDTMARATLRKNLLTIGEGAFQNCSLLATISLPTTVTDIGAYAFENCSSIPSIIIPSGVTSLNNSVFSNCSSLANVAINSKLTFIGKSAFYNCAFSSIELPITVNTIDEAAFRHCISLSSIVIPDATKEIGDAAFLDCVALAMVSLPDDVTNTGISVFSNNNDLTICIRYLTGKIADGILDHQGVCHIVIDSNIIEVGSNAFDSCHDLSTITYGENTINTGEFLLSPNVTSIGDQAFRDTTLLKNLIVPDTLQTIGANAFYNDIASQYNCTDVTVTFYYVGGKIASNILKGQKISHVVVNDNISLLGNNAFNNIATLETISLPDTISDCGTDVFALSGNGNVILTIRGVDGTVDANVYKGRTSGIGYVVIDNGVETIDDYSFADSTTIRGVVVKDVELIGKDAFRNGINISYVEIGNATTIDEYAFAECLLLKRVELDSIVNINDYGFYNCIAMDDLYIHTGLVRIGEHSFEECKLLPAVVLPDTTNYIGAYAFYDCNSLKSINIPNGIDAINNYTFFGCASLLSVNLPDTVKSIGDYAYYGCVLISDLNLDNSIETIGKYAFYNCNQVKAIVLPCTVKMVDDYAFRSCSSVKEISLPDSVTTLGDCVFYGCIGLEQAEFGTGITSIGDRVFYACVNLKKLVLNGNVTNIHDLAFYGAEDTVIYSFENEYVEVYCYDTGLEYYELANNFTMVLNVPSKTEYTEFESLDLSDLTLDITYENGIERTISTGYQISGYDPKTVGVQTVTITYNGKTATFDVNVTAKVVSYIVITSGAPSSVILGEEPDCSKMKLKVVFADATSIEITDGYTLSGFDPSVLGEQEVTVNYREGMEKFKINVIDYIRGDINGDGIVSMKDVTRLTNYLNDPSAAVIDKALDVNGDGVINIKDITRLVEYLNNNAVVIF